MPTVRSSYPTRPRMPTPEIRLRRAQETADIAVEDAAEAQADADAAQATGDQAVLDAAAAQEDADLAAAAAAQAQTDADAAQGTADTAVVAAGAAQADATQALADAAAVDGRVDDVTGGVEAFTALNVGGTNVKPFLDKTDGSVLTDAAGLDDGLVGTTKIAAGAVTSPAQTVTAAFTTIASTSETTIATEAVTLAADEYVDLLGSFGILAIGGDPTNIGDTAAQIIASIYRDTTKIAEGPVGSVIKGVTLNASATLPQIDEPGAGTYSYTLRAKLTSTTDVTQATAGNRSLRVMAFKR